MTNLFFRHLHGHHRRRGHAFEEGMRGGRGRRLLHRGELKLLLLKLLEDGPRHGYDLIKDIEAKTSGAYAPSPGVLYPTLAMLEDMGVVASQSDGSRKAFALTETGSKELSNNAETANALLARLERIGTSQATTEAGPVRRAMDNLRHVLAAKAGSGPIAKEVQHDIADILDDAARQIERL